MNTAIAVEVGTVDTWNKEQTKLMSAEEKKIYGDYNGKMQAEDDLRTMAEYKNIKKDKKRLRRAVLCAKHKAKLAEHVSMEVSGDDYGSHSSHNGGPKKKKLMNY